MTYRKRLWWVCGVSGAVSAVCGVVSLPACGTKSGGLLPDSDASTDSGDDVGDGDGGDTFTPPSLEGGGHFVGGDGGVMMVLMSDAGNGLCTLGAAGSFATQASLNLFGQVVYYNDGGALPAGHYRIQYIDGCMKYGTGYNWMCNGSPGDAFYLVNGGASTNHILVCPGTNWGGLFNPSVGSYANFDDCVAANKALPPTDFYYDGGPLGIGLSDWPYSDNTAGQDGRNPKWSLTLLEKCPPNIIEVPIPPPPK